MAFSDPQTVSVAGEALTLPRVSSGVNSGAFRYSDDYTLVLSVTHTEGKRNRHIARLKYERVLADPLQPALNIPVDMSVTLTVDTPKRGLDNEGIQDIVGGLVGWLTANTGANVVKLVGGQN